MASGGQAADDSGKAALPSFRETLACSWVKLREVRIVVIAQARVHGRQFVGLSGACWTTGMNSPLLFCKIASWVKDLDPQVDLVRGVFTGPAFSSVLTCYLTFSDAQERTDY